MMFARLFFKYIVFLIILFSLNKNVYAQQNQEIYITGSYQSVPLIDVLSSLESRYKLRFYYQAEWLTDRIISAEFSEEPLNNVLNEVLSGTSCEYTIIQEKEIILLPRDKVAAAKGKLKNFSSTANNTNINQVGNPADAGKHRIVELDGIITDGKTGESLIGTTILVENTKFAAVTDENGHYSFTLSPGHYTLQVASLGFEKTSFEIKLISKGSFNIELFEESRKIDEVVVYAKDAERNVKSTQMSIVELSSKMIKQLPSVNGEKDIIKSFTMMPGVQSVGEFGSGINVRGGGEDQNLILIEDVPVFNTSHVFGMLSILNPDVVRDVSLYKGHIPPRYGERVSSVMDISLLDNDKNKFGGKGGLGIYNSRLLLTVPMIKDRATFKIAARSSYSDWILQKLPDYNLQNSSTSFYDITALFNADLKHNRISLFGYKSHDKFQYANNYTYSYGNELGSFSLLTYFSSDLTGRLILASSSYAVTREDFGLLQENRQTDYKLNYFTGKYNINYTGINGHDIETGIQYIHYRIQPGELSPLGTNSLIIPTALQPENAREMALYLSDNFDVTKWLSFNIGIRFSRYNCLGNSQVYVYAAEVPKNVNSITDTLYYAKGDIIKTYNGIEPRVSLKLQTSKTSSVKLSYNRNNQYITLLSYTSISTPKDRWKLADPTIKPIVSDQYALGYYRNWLNNLLETSVEFYSKNTANLSEFKNDANIDMNPTIDIDLINATGRNYGAELMFRKNSGDFEGWVSYTYSRSLRQTNGVFAEEKINDNKWFPSSVDKPHNLSIVTTYHFNKRWRFTGTFNYSTGRAVTLPEYQYKSGGYQLIYYSDRNKYRLPDYHRLDLAISLDESLRRSKKWKGSWTFSIINVYGRKNAYSVFYQKEKPSIANDYKQYSLYTLYIIGIPFPSITYNFIF